MGHDSYSRPVPDQCGFSQEEVSMISPTLRRALLSCVTVHLRMLIHGPMIQELPWESSKHLHHLANYFSSKKGKNTADCQCLLHPGPPSPAFRMSPILTLQQGQARSLLQWLVPCNRRFPDGRRGEGRWTGWEILKPLPPKSGLEILG